MKDLCESSHSAEYSWKSLSESRQRISSSVSSKAGPSSSKVHKSTVLSCFSVSAFYPRKETNRIINGWTEAVRRVMYGDTMRRILGFNQTGIAGSMSDIWFLGKCYKVAEDNSSADPTQSEGYAAFVEDFSSRILITYRKGFPPIGDSNYTSDAGWGCMIRSSQMLVAQALLFHRLGRSWRKPLDKPLEHNYVEVLHLFGDSESSAYSIHNLLQAGKAYGLAPGSWVGPYAMCRTWETLVRCKKKETENGALSSVMHMYVVSGDEDGERGGVPAVCVEDISRHCLEFSEDEDQVDWTPLLLLVPLVLGLDKINPRYLPLLGATFSFPQSLGILGGKPGASTYIVGMQDEKAFYLDPHEVQTVVDVRKDDLEVDTSSYHCRVNRHFPFESIDPSLAIGFYCKDKNDFEDFCLRASELVNQSNGAPLFTISETRNSPKPVGHHCMSSDNATLQNDSSFDVVHADESENCEEDDWQLL